MYSGLVVFIRPDYSSYHVRYDIFTVWTLHTPFSETNVKTAKCISASEYLAYKTRCICLELLQLWPEPIIIICYVKIVLSIFVTMLPFDNIYRKLSIL